MSSAATTYTNKTCNHQSIKHSFQFKTKITYPRVRKSHPLFDSLRNRFNYSTLETNSGNTLCTNGPDSNGG